MPAQTVISMEPARQQQWNQAPIDLADVVDRFADTQEEVNNTDGSSHTAYDRL